MQGTGNKPSKESLAANRLRLLEGMHLQAIEGNPLDADDVAMFEMFEREGWSDERRRAYILLQVPAAAK